MCVEKVESRKHGTPHVVYHLSPPLLYCFHGMHHVHRVGIGVADDLQRFRPRGRPCGCLLLLLLLSLAGRTIGRTVGMPCLICCIVLKVLQLAVVAPALGRHGQGHPQPKLDAWSLDHFFGHQSIDRVHVVLRDFQHDLVVHHQDNLGVGLFHQQPMVHVVQDVFENVRGRPLAPAEEKEEEEEEEEEEEREKLAMSITAIVVINGSGGGDTWHCRQQWLWRMLGNGHPECRYHPSC